MTYHSDTRKKLLQMTDNGKFEILAVAVLCKHSPELYKGLGHQGVNADGKTVKAPIDNFAYLMNANPPHVVMAHHTTRLAKDLEKKWLYDQAALGDATRVEASKRKKTKIPDGDIIKTAKEVQEKRKKQPRLQATLAITTNQEPSDTLYTLVQEAGEKYNISIDIWSGSRIARYLDNDSEGQWLRWKYLGIWQEKLSKDLLYKLSQDSLSIPKPEWMKSDEIINRELDNIIKNQSPRPIVFILGEAGWGKSIACYKLLEAHVAAGGFGLVLSHETLAAHYTLDQAIDAELRKLHSSLAPLNLNVLPRSFCSPENPFLIIVEDINKADQPAILLERLLKWIPKKSSQRNRKIGACSVLLGQDISFHYLNNHKMVLKSIVFQRQCSQTRKLLLHYKNVLCKIKLPYQHLK